MRKLWQRWGIGVTAGGLGLTLGCAGEPPVLAADPGDDAAEAALLTTAVSAEPIVLSGRITDREGKPVEGVRVQLYSGLATRWEGQFAFTDGDGVYRFDNLETGSMTQDEATQRWDYFVGMRLEHAEYVPADGTTWLDITVPGIGGTEFRQDFTMVRGGTIDMTLETSDGFGLSEFDVRLMRMEEDREVGSEYATTDRKGHFVTQALFPGEWSVQWNWGAADYAELTRVRVEPGMVTERSVKLTFEVKVVE